MKPLVTIISLVTFSSIQMDALGAEKPGSNEPPSSKVGEAVKSKIDKAAAVIHKATGPAVAPSEASAQKAIPMYSEVSAIDAAGKTFTHKNKDGKEVRFVVTTKTEIKNATAAAKFEEIKVGHFVSGLRIKKSDTEYEVVKITKFGPKAEK